MPDPGDPTKYGLVVERPLVYLSTVDVFAKYHSHVHGSSSSSVRMQFNAIEWIAADGLAMLYPADYKSMT